MKYTTMVTLEDIELICEIYGHRRIDQPDRTQNIGDQKAEDKTIPTVFEQIKKKIIDLIKD